MSRRELERNNVSAIRLLPITLRIEGREDVPATVLDVTTRGIAVLTEQSSEQAEPFETAEIAMKIRGEDVNAVGILRSHARVGNRDRFGFEVEDWGANGESLISEEHFPELDRRRDQRVFLGEDELKEVRMWEATGDWETTGRLVDVSRSGLCFEVQDLDELPDPEARFRVTFWLPGLAEELKAPVVFVRERGDLFALQFDEAWPGLKELQQTLDAFIQGQPAERRGAA